MPTPLHGNDTKKNGHYKNAMTAFGSELNALKRFSEALQM